MLSGHLLLGLTGLMNIHQAVARFVSLFVLSLDRGKTSKDSEGDQWQSIGRLHVISSSSARQPKSRDHPSSAAASNGS